MLQEFYWSSVCWYWSFPFAGFSFRPCKQHTGLPVLLIHGYGCNSGYWSSLSRLLQKQNITHSAIDCEPVLAGIDDYAVLIHNAITTLCQQTGQTQVIILGHSMGGLSARAYMRRYGEEKIARLITLGTPHHGSKLAAAAWGMNAYQMRWNDNQEASSWVNTLNAASTPATCSKIVSIYSRHDNIVSPQHSSYLPHARNIEIDLVGHVALAFTKQSVNIVMQEITAARENKLISENR
jgi:triacylglycerol esterase/lipase EstA (alpha/beta hydrolase family)